MQSAGRRVAGRFLTMLASPNTLDRDRLGIIASKRVGGSVQRNRAKRRLREVFRRQAASPSTARRLDLVVIAKPELVGAPILAVSAEFEAALKKLRGAR